MDLKIYKLQGLTKTRDSTAEWGEAQSNLLPLFMIMNTEKRRLQTVCKMKIR